MKKMNNEHLGTLAKELNTLCFDIDPYNGMTEEEGMEETVNCLTEDPGITIDWLNSIISDEDLPEYWETAKSLKERVSAFCAG